MTYIPLPLFFSSSLLIKTLFQILDAELFEHMHHHGDYTHFYFCYRWFLLDFKRGQNWSLCSVHLSIPLCFVHCLAVQFQRSCSIFFTKLQNQDNCREEQCICVIIVCLWPCLLTGRSNLGVFLHVNIILMV